MMKKLIVIVIAVFISLQASSQVKFGLKAGVSTTNLTMETLKTLTSGTTSYTVTALQEANYGFHGGAFVRFSLMKFYLQPELLFTSRTDQYTIEDVSGSLPATIAKQEFNKLELPLMLGLYLGPIRLNAGPSAALLINSPKDLIDNPDFKTMYSNLTFGYQAGLGVDILKRLTFDIRYEGSLQKYQTEIENIAGTSFKLDDRPNAFSLSLGLIF